MAIACAPALAAILPPGDNHQIINLSYDKKSPLANSYIWQNAVREDTRTSWLCQSETDSRTGACATRSVWENSVGYGPITLRFTEMRSQLSIDIQLTGARDNGSYLYPINTAKGARAGYSSLIIFIPQSELAKLPTGGVWKAKLILNEMQWDPYIKVATFSADITLNVTDKNNGAIYLPAFGSATPRVDLNLRTKPLSTAPGGEVSGQSTIDMCLYDGYNSNSPWLKVTLADQQNVAGRAADVFSVSRDGSSATAAADRIDYRVTLNYNNQPQKVNNGQAITLTGVNTALIRPVVLPGIPFPVVCTPAPLTLDVLPFAKLSKAAGHFTGTLRVTLSADALAP
ncbi:CfaE/CblD family pilus tip adhesin [Serratia liquefaciens]